MSEFWMRLLIVQAADGGSAPSDLAVQSVWDFVVKGGWMMVPLGLCSLVVLAVSLERLIALRRSALVPGGFADQIGVVAEREGLARAVEACRSNGSALASVCAAGLGRLALGIEAAERQAGEAGAREIHRMRRRLRALTVVASVAPLMGLLGTIFGMIRAFQTVAVSGEALGRTEMLARGIYEAMITTAAGLLVAIPALLMHHWISARIEGIAAAIERETMGLLERASAGARGTRRADASRDGSRGIVEAVEEEDLVSATGVV